ncbi:MAG: 3-deoxy-manno-octulosonate cytidylyltransferase [Candidatus Omnitrophica bacterium]|nr:3-deoxy-manno-octulosonate cytidylyltransferase [Candidatus Omnitrophota bacterium]MBU1038576.1 3-deoxy-manno-octulosonate cytidylyltransferase [Candidatus Omnitrophota bacterium]MBU1808635.1 3-deoxy-manno-octulosonate cytidylyltransferase [Candidatus Omnitrophota bacterium]
MKAIGVIPARWGATRFEGKVLANLLGTPVIQHVWENAKKARTLDDLIVACDDERILKAVEGFGGKAIYTSPDQPSGTDRLAEVVNAMSVDIVVNIQGDEPLIKPIMIDNLVMALQEEKIAQMATIIKKIDDDSELTNSNVVKVVVDKNGYALYFSRYSIPYNRTSAKDSGKRPVYYKHIGLYAFTKDFLFTFKKLPHSSLENAEKLEQLRALEYGYKIRVVETKFDTVGVDRPEDLKRAEEALLREREV